MNTPNPINNKYEWATGTILETDRWQLSDGTLIEIPDHEIGLQTEPPHAGIYGKFVGYVRLKP